MWPANVYFCPDLALVPKRMLTSVVKGSVTLAYGKRYISKSTDPRSEAKQTPCIILYYDQQNAQFISLKYISQQCFPV